MKVLGRVLIIGLALSFVFVHWSFAERVSLTISCAIPAIPGVNAPLLEKETLKAQTEDSAKQQEKSYAQAQQKPQQVIQQDSQEEKQTKTGEKTLMVVKTFYSR